MGLTISSINKYGVGNRWHVTAQIAFDSSYPTGGEELLAASLGLKSIEFMLIENKSGIVFEYDYSNYKVKGYRTAAASTHTHTHTITNGTAGNAVTFNTDHLEATGGGTLTSSAGGSIAQAALAEVTNATNLSAVTGVRLFAIGY